MKKILILFIVYLSLGVMISIIQSCGLLKHDAWIKDIDFEGIYSSKDSDIDDLTNNIGFQVRAWSRSVSASVFIKDIDIFSKCYATTSCAEWQNYLDISSFSMTFDRNFVYDSDTIISGTCIFEIETIKEDILIDKDNDECKFIFYTMNFSSELTNKLIFESGEYICYFSCKTTDGREFNKSRKVIFKQG